MSDANEKSASAAHRSRGFVAIGLHRPKNSVNIGSVLRAAQCFESNLVIVGSPRPFLKHRSVTQCCTDTQKAWKHIPSLVVEDLLDAHPVGSIPVAVDLVPGALPLPSFKHPEGAFYIFGPEDGTLGKSILDRCAVRLMIPSSFCLNLAAAVNVVLYDRAAKGSERWQRKEAA